MPSQSLETTDEPPIDADHDRGAGANLFHAAKSGSLGRVRGLRSRTCWSRLHPDPGKLDWRSDAGGTCAHRRSVSHLQRSARIFAAAAAVCVTTTLAMGALATSIRAAPAPVPAPVAATSGLPEADVSAPPTAAELLEILVGVPGKPIATALIVDLASGAVVMDVDAGRVVFPASVEKMFTTAAVLRSLPHDRRLATVVRGTLDGRGKVAVLALVGGGDPTMAVGDWTRLADATAKAGVRSVGRLVVDSTLFDDANPRGFDEKTTDAAFRAPVGALTCDGATLQVTVRPGPAGAPPTVTVTPDAADAVVVRNEAETVKKGRSSLAVVARALGRRTEVVVTGRMPRSQKTVGTGRRRVADASYFAAGVFRALLQKRGIAVEGSTAFQRAPADLPLLAQHNSPTLLEIVRTTNKTSHNGYAETLYKLAAALHGQVPATAERAEVAVRQAFDGLAVRWAGVQLGNGSGLYHASKVTCEAVVDLVGTMAQDPAGAAWRASLAVGGIDGTLRGRLHHVVTKGRVHAKTGTLDDVVGLAGYAAALDGRTYAFAFFYNGVRAAPGPYRAAHDKVLRRLLGGT